VLALGLDATIEAKVGKRPDPPALTALPPLAPLAKTPGLAVLYLPVVADYDVLEPVIDKALAKRAARPRWSRSTSTTRTSTEVTGCAALDDTAHIRIEAMHSARMPGYARPRVP
jgi:hypothetical protein